MATIATNPSEGASSETGILYPAVKNKFKLKFLDFDKDSLKIFAMQCVKYDVTITPDLCISCNGSIPNAPKISKILSITFERDSAALLDIGFDYLLKNSNFSNTHRGNYDLKIPPVVIEQLDGGVGILSSLIYNNCKLIKASYGCDYAQNGVSTLQLEIAFSDISKYQPKL